MDKNEIAEFIKREGNVDVPIEDDTKLFSGGIIDSFFMIEMILHFESEVGIKIEPEDITLDNLDSIEKIHAYIQQQCQ